MKVSSAHTHIRDRLHKRKPPIMAKLPAISCIIIAPVFMYTSHTRQYDRVGDHNTSK